MHLAKRTKVIEKTKIEESLRLMEEHPEIISLGAGEPDFDAPPNVVKAAQKFLSEGFTHYGPLQGRNELREAVAKKLKKENKMDVGPEEVIITVGSKEAILLSMLIALDQGDEVLIPDPGYIAYRPIAQTIDAVPISVKLREEDEFQFHPEILGKLITKKTRAIMINTPSNPTGTVFSKKTLEQIADFVVQHELMLISDEAYEKLVYDDSKHISFASLNGMEKYSITLQTFSKSFAMCGFRIGYAVATPEKIKEMREFKICTTLAAPTPFQMAAVEALRGSSSYTEMMRNEYDRRRKMLIARLNEIPNIHCTTPKGAFYAFPNIIETGMKSIQFSDFLIEKAKVITIPGTEFGKFGEGFVRLSFATGYGKIEKALDRIETTLKKLH